MFICMTKCLGGFFLAHQATVSTLNTNIIIMNPEENWSCRKYRGSCSYFSTLQSFKGARPPLSPTHTLRGERWTWTIYTQRHDNNQTRSSSSAKTCTSNLSRKAIKEPITPPQHQFSINAYLLHLMLSLVFHFYFLFLILFLFIF